MNKIPRMLDVEGMIALDYIEVHKHPTAELYQYNYTRKAQEDKMWNEATEFCRGLIVNKEGHIISRPFTKFFNYEELVIMGRKIPSATSKFSAYEKLDGSLGIMYWIDDTPYIATRGSFVSEQALHATNILHTKYAHLTDTLRKYKDRTFLFEIVYPENHMVVSYGDLDDIILLAIIDNKTGDDYDIYEWSDSFTCAKMYDGVDDYTKIRDMFSGENREGFVIRFEDGFRMKLKYEEYFRLHFLASNISKIRIIRSYIEGDPDRFSVIIKDLDEENRMYFTDFIERINKRYKEIESEALSEYAEFDTDKEAAAVFKLSKFSGILFAKRNGKDYSKAIWKMIHEEIRKEIRKDLEEENE